MKTGWPWTDLRYARADLSLLIENPRPQLAATVVFAEQPHGPYDYAIPPSLAAKLKAGQRVQVPLGRGNRPNTRLIRKRQQGLDED